MGRTAKKREDNGTEERNTKSYQKIAIYLPV